MRAVFVSSRECLSVAAHYFPLARRDAGDAWTGCRPNAHSEPPGSTIVIRTPIAENMWANSQPRKPPADDHHSFRQFRFSMMSSLVYCAPPQSQDAGGISLAHPRRSPPVSAREFLIRLIARR